MDNDAFFIGKSSWRSFYHFAGLVVSTVAAILGNAAAISMFDWSNFILSMNESFLESFFSLIFTLVSLSFVPLATWYSVFSLINIFTNRVENQIFTRRGITARYTICRFEMLWKDITCIAAFERKWSDRYDIYIKNRKWTSAKTSSWILVRIDNGLSWEEADKLLRGVQSKARPRPKVFHISK